MSSTVVSNIELSQRTIARNPVNKRSPYRFTRSACVAVFCADMLPNRTVTVAKRTTIRAREAGTFLTLNMKQISSSRQVFVLFAVLIGAFVPLLSQPASKTYKITQTGNASPGYFMISPARSDTLGVIDNYGRAVFPLNVGMQINLSSYKNRELSYFGVTNTGGVLGFSCFVRMNHQQQITDSICPVGPYQADFHEGFASSDSTFVILGAYRVKTDLSKYVAGGFPDAEIIGGVIQEITRSGRVIFEWKSLDHIPYQDATDDIDFTQPLVDVHHINAIVRDTDGGLIISIRHLDEVIKINGQTGKIIWRLGGSKSKNNQFRFLNDTVAGFFGFSHQHCVSRTPSGTLLMFDNGNLKPEPQSSRVVEYEIDENEKTVRKVFEYQPEQKVFASTMGSVSRLPNGNFLVGYGSALNLSGVPSDIAAEEIDREGNVVARVDNLPLPRLNAYRIRKTTYGMTGLQRTINAVGTTSFSEIDSTTLITVQTATTRRPAVVTVERHHYAPQNVTYTSPMTLYYPPARWGIRVDDSTALAGTTRLKLSKVMEVEDPKSVVLLYRPVEGSGPFSTVSATYSTADSSWTIPFIKQGEYAVAYTNRLRPELLAPLNKSIDVDERPKFRWNRLLFASSYQLQVARDSAFTIGVESYTVTDTVYTPEALRNNTVFWWRMRKVSSQGTGPWSAHWRFTTIFNRPRILEPTADTQAVFVNAENTFRWTSVKGANSYRVVVSDSASGRVLDSVFTDTTCRLVGLLPTDVRLSWNVRAIIDTVTGQPSMNCNLTTAPQRPSLVIPEPNVFLPNTTKTLVTWVAVNGVTRYRLNIVTLPESEPIVDTVIQGVTSFMVEGLESGFYRWNCVSLGKYGPSLPSVRDFAIAERSSLAKPTISGSLQRSGISASNPTECAWLKVQGAATYHVQVAEDVVFDNPIIDTVIDRESIGLVFGRASSLYAWRVQARNGFDISPWSDTVYASTVIDSSRSIVPLYPVHGTNAAKADDVFRFQGNERFYGYQVDVARDPRFNSIDYKLYCFTDSAAYTFLTEGQRYFWRVLGTTLSGQTYRSQVSTMIVNTDLDVASEEPSGASIWTERSADEVLIRMTGLGSIESVRVYNLLGQCIRSEGPFDTTPVIRITSQNSDHLYVIVTNSAGNAYYVAVR
ncbi:MAG: hypothetical protein FGM32_04990 [Candidatus Kapabacteria bacterium]|nr:hypothetical protein [Candidatus Kapabacteria bacterium]